LLRQQALAFLFSLSAGFAAGIIFDIYQVIRRLLGLRKVGTAIGDVLVWLVIAASAFILLIIGNWAELRLYVLLSMVIGLGLYLRLFSRWIQKAVFKFFLVLGWTIKTTIRIVIFPYNLALKLLTYPVAALKWLCLLLVRVVEYATSFPYLAIQNVIRERRLPPPKM
jgi:spore cortex biosynthesis protein YabQ